MQRPDRPPWSWPGVVAVILAASLGVGWAAGVIILAATPQQIEPTTFAAVDGLGHTLAGAVAAYLGYQIGETRRLLHRD